MENNILWQLRNKQYSTKSDRLRLVTCSRFGSEKSLNQLAELIEC